MRPERPALEGQAPAPLSGAVAIPSVVKGALMTWHVSLFLSAFAIVTMILTRAGLITRLKEALIERDPSVAGQTLDKAAPRIVFVAVAALALIVLIEFVLIRLFAAKHSWPRFALVLIVMLHAVVAVLTSLLVPETAWQAWTLTIALYLGALVALGATVRSFFPGVSNWTKKHHSETGLS